MANYGDAIQAALVNAAKAWNFPTVSYTTPGDLRQTAVGTIKAKTVLAYQVGTLFQVPASNRRTWKRERGPWTWTLELRFDRPVSLEEFEQSLVESPLRVSRDPANGLLHQVDLLLEESTYQEAVTKQPAMGPRAQLRFTAQTSPT